MKYVTPFLFLLFTVNSMAQLTIKLDDIKNHIGDSVQLIAKIYDGTYLESSTGAPTLISVGAISPNALLILLVQGSTRLLFRESPESVYEGKEWWITGRLEMDNGKPEIVVHSLNQVYAVIEPPASK